MDMILMNETTSKMAESWIIDGVSISSDDESTWEIIDPSDDESPDFSFPFDSEDDPQNDTREPSDSPPKKIPKKLLILERYNYNCSYYDSRHDVDDDDDEEEEEEEEGSGSDGLDDELVPRSVSGRFGRNRMRKLGKREYSKMAKSKKLPVIYNRPGCVHGKHGLGLKHSLM